MKLSLEISMYPLDKNYTPPIANFIERLNKHENILIKTNTMSTQIFGDFDLVMKAFQTELKASFFDETKIVVVTKFFNGDLSE